MHLITYISDYKGTDATIHDDIDQITSVAKARNAKDEITGVLFYMENKFLQVIEGEEKGVIRKLGLIEQPF